MKNTLSLKTLFSLLLSSIPASTHAQNFLPDADIILNPLDSIKSSFYPIPKKSIKQIVYITAGDTTSISDLDPEGHEYLNIGYSKNKPVNKLVYKKTDYGIETLFYGNYQKELQVTHKYKYDKKGNVTEWERIGYSPIHWYFEYDSNNRLRKKYTIGEIAVSQKARLHEYVYDTTGKLTEIAREQWLKKFSYDGDRLTVQNEFYINGDINTLNSFRKYSYDTAGRLTGLVSNLDSTQYLYDGSQLKRMISYKKDATYETVDFFYEKNLLQKAVIRTNTIYTGALFIFPIQLIPPGKDQASEREMQFFYDHRNNIKEIKYFAEGSYKCNKQFIYQYY